MSTSAKSSSKTDLSEASSPVKTSGHIGRIIAIIAVVAAFLALFIVSANMKETPADKAWNIEMTVGPSDASRSYVMYTDLMCPYCDVFSREALNHWDEFTAFLDEHNILFEIRLTDALYEGNGIKASRNAAEAAYCAKRENKFWEYYHGAIKALWDDYQSKGIGSNKSATPISNMPEDYWLAIGHKAGLGETFDNCVKNRETATEVVETTYRALQYADGMPTFKFGKFSNSGFSDTWDWPYVKMYLDAGLK